MTRSGRNHFVPIPKLSTNERRAQPRQRVLLTGVLSDSRHEASQSCSVRNLSETGARLQLPGSDLSMSWGSLIVVRDACVYTIEPVWVAGDQAGVRLVRSQSLQDASGPALDRPRALWLEKLPRSGVTWH